MRSRKETLEDMGEYRERFSKARPGALAGWPLLGATCFIAVDLLLDIRELLMRGPLLRGELRREVIPDGQEVGPDGKACQCYQPGGLYFVPASGSAPTAGTGGPDVELVRDEGERDDNDSDGQ
ncbi:MAG: hypothetical protein ACYTEX_22160 [Planctomycetota bacterium]|jgi:hypothetical protein